MNSNNNLCNLVITDQRDIRHLEETLLISSIEITDFCLTAKTKTGENVMYEFSKLVAPSDLKIIENFSKGIILPKEIYITVGEMSVRFTVIKN